MVATVAKKGTKANPAPGGMRRWQVCLAPFDFSSLAWLKEKYNYNSVTEPIHYCIRKVAQVERTADVILAAAKIVKTPGWKRRQGVKVEQWSCWMSDDDFAFIEEIRHRFSMRYQSEAVRLAIRLQTILEGGPQS